MGLGSTVVKTNPDSTGLVRVHSHSIVSDPLGPHRLQPSRLLCPWDFPGKKTGLGCHVLLKAIFLIQGSNLTLGSPALAGRFFTSLPLQNAQDKKCRMGEHTLITKETQTKEEISSRHSLLPLTEGFSCDFRAGGKEKSAKLREKAEKQILRDGRYNF